MSPDRLTPLDASFLLLTPQQMSVAVVVLDPRDGGVVPSLQDLRGLVAGRLAHVPRSRQRLQSVPGAVALPVWVDDASFDLDMHVLAPAGTQRLSIEDLERLTARFITEPFDLSYPLWRIWLAHLADGGAALIIGAHHTLADGIATLAFFAGLLLGGGPEAAYVEPEPWEPAPVPTDEELLADAEREREEARLGTLVPRRRPRSARTWAAIAAQGRSLVDTAAAVAGVIARGVVERTEPAPFNIDVTTEGGVAVALRRRHLDDLRRIGRAAGATVNDVVLAATAGGMRRWLAARGEEVRDLRALVPALIADDDPSNAELQANNAARFFVTLPVTEPDPVKRLTTIVARTSEIKRRGDVAAEAELERLVYSLPPKWRARAEEALSHGPWSFNLVVDNVTTAPPGMDVLGCPVRQIFPAVSLSSRDGMGITFISFGDHVGISYVTNGVAVPDADALADSVDIELDLLVDSTRAGGPATA